MEQKKSPLGMIILIAVVLGFIFFLMPSPDPPALSITGFFDSEGNRINVGSASVVNTIEGVTAIEVSVNAKNLDTTDLTLEILDTLPSELTSSIDTTAQTVAPNEFATWVSTPIPVAQWEGTTQVFEVMVEGSSPLRNAFTKTTQMSVSVSVNPDANFDLTIGSGLDDAGMIPPIADGEITLQVFDFNGIPSDINNPVVVGAGVQVWSDFTFSRTIGQGIPNGFIQVVEWHESELERHESWYDIYQPFPQGQVVELPTIHSLSDGRTMAVAQKFEETTESTSSGIMLFKGFFGIDPNSDSKVTFYPLDVDGNPTNTGKAEVIIYID